MNTYKINKAMAQHIINDIKDLIDTEKSDLHHELFNMDYWVIGTYNALQELKNWSIDSFEAINSVREYENDNFGEFTTDIQEEKIVNMLTYIQGEEVIYNAFNNLDIDNNGYIEEEEADQIIEFLKEEYLN